MKTSGEFQSGPYGGVQVGLDAFVTKFSADGSTVLWTTYLAGSGDDSAHAVAVNSSDQAYVVGDTDSCITPSEAEPNQNYDPNSALPIVRFPFTSDAVQTLCSPAAGSHNSEVDGTNTTVFLVKLSSDGTTELYGTPIGGSNGDYASSIVLDATGRPYIVGETNSTGYYKCIGAPGNCDVPAYPVDQHGNADYGTANFPTTANAAFSNVSLAVQYDTTDNSGNVSGPAIEQAFITVLSADLHSFVYSSLIGGGVLGYCGNGLCNTYGNAVAVNAAGQAFIGGETSSAHWPITTNAFAASCPNAGAATSTCNLTGWLAGFDPSKSGAASLLFSTYMTGSSAGLDSNGNSINTASDVYGLAVDASGNVVATGDTNADNFPTTAGTFEPACTQFNGGGSTKLCQSAYITKLSPAGATVWSTYYTPLTSPGNPVVGQGVALDASGNVFVVGTSTASTLPLVKTLTTNGAQYNDAFVIELSPTGASLLMGTYLGSGGGISLDNNSLHLDSSLNAYFTGYQGYNNYGGTSFPVTSNAPQSNLQGTDGWVVKLITQQQVSSTALQITPSSGTPGTSISFTATVTGLPTFATPTGTVTLTNGSTTLGTITLANGTGTFSTTTLAAGTYSVIATYSGDVVYATSASTAQPLAILNTPTVVLAATPASATLGTAVALKATVSSSAGTPTGTVYFLDGTTTLGSCSPLWRRGQRLGHGPRRRHSLHHGPLRRRHKLLHPHLLAADRHHHRPATLHQRCLQPCEPHHHPRKHSLLHLDDHPRQRLCRNAHLLLRVVAQLRFVRLCARQPHLHGQQQRSAEHRGYRLHQRFHHRCLAPRALRPARRQPVGHRLGLLAASPGLHTPLPQSHTQPHVPLPEPALALACRPERSLRLQLCKPCPHNTGRQLLHLDHGRRSSVGHRPQPAHHRPITAACAWPVRHTLCSRTGHALIHSSLCRRPDDRCPSPRMRSKGGGKSELRRAVCRITSGMRASRRVDGQCNRKETALDAQAARVRVKRWGKSPPRSW